MRHEILIELEDSADKLEHSRECLTECLVNGIKCSCGVEDIREAISKYKLSLWKENRSG